MMSEREAVLGNAIEALTRIKNDFQMTYKKHQEAYQNLREALVELQDHVREQRTEREKVVALPLAGTVVEETRIVPLTNNYKFIDDIVAQGEERVDEEVTRYERLTEDQTHHFSFFENILTMLHYRKGDVEKAKNRLYKALMSDRGNSELYAQLGYIFQKQKKAVRAGFFYFFAKLADRNKIVSNCMRIFDYAPEESDDRYDKVMKRVGFKSRARRVYRALEKQGQSDFEFTNPLSGEKLMFTTDQRTTDSLDNVVQLEQFRYKRKSVQVYYQAPQTLQKVA